MWMQPAPAHHLGPMRMGLREPAWTNPLCRVASHALFGPLLRSGSPPMPDRRKLPESADLTSGNLRNARTHRLVSRLEPAAVPAVSNGSYPTPVHPGAAHPSRGSGSQTNGIKSPALAEAARAGREQVIRSRGKRPLRREPVHRFASRQSNHANPNNASSISRPNADVDATGPGTSLGTDADEAPRTCVD